MKKTILSSLVAFGLAAFAQIQQANSIQTVHGRGRNADYRTAVYEALVQAASQVQGVSLQDSRDAFMDSTAQLRKTKSGDSDVSEVRESLKQNVSAKTKGRVLSYEITQERFDKEMNLWYVELDAKVPGQYTVGLPADNRRRMVVMPFRSLTDKVNVFGQTLQVGTTCETIAAALNENLVQTRRFTMLDRAFNAETTAELSRLNLENASAGDFGRFQQLLVTDYMVIGTVKMYPSPSASYNQWTVVPRDRLSRDPRADEPAQVGRHHHRAVFGVPRRFNRHGSRLRHVRGRAGGVPRHRQQHLPDARDGQDNV